MTTSDHDLVRDVFERLVSAEPPLTVAPAHLREAAATEHRRVRRRRTTIAAAAATAVGLAAALVLVGSALDGGDSAPLVPQASETGSPTATDPAPQRSATAGVSVTTAGAVRIEQQMALALLRVHPDGGVSTTQRQATAAEPQAAWRFRVDGVPGYLDLRTWWTPSDADRDTSCEGWAECLESPPPPLPRDGYALVEQPDGTEVGQLRLSSGGLGGPVVLVSGTLPDLLDEASARALVEGARLFVEADDLDGSADRNDALPLPDDEQRSRLDQLRALGSTWADDLDLPEPVPSLQGRLAPSPEPWRSGGLLFPGGDDQVASVSFPLTATTPADPVCREPRLRGERCDVRTVEGGAVVVYRNGPRALLPGAVALELVRDDGVAVRWSFDRLPDGFTLDQLVAYVAGVGVPVEPR